MDRTKLFPIGEVSKLFHISVSSLRHYENIGLLTPEYVSPDSGYRYYSAGQFEVLNTIRYLRALDLPLLRKPHRGTRALRQAPCIYSRTQSAHKRLFTGDNAHRLRRYERPRKIRDRDMHPG